MLVSEDTFQDLNCEQGVASELTCLRPILDPDPPAPISAMAAIGPQIEAEIPYLRRVVRRWHREATDADDLVQETLLRALAGAHLWQPETSMRAWLCTIMRNQFLAALARTQRSKVAIGEMQVADHHGPSYPELQLTLRDLDRAFSRLPEKQRSPLRLAGIAGKSYSEVARAMGLTPDAVRCHLARARERLRTAVDRRDETTWIRSTASAA